MTLQQQITKPCEICGVEGIETAVEKLPKTGVLIQSTHNDGSKHQWVIYSSLGEVIQQPRKTRNTRIICPKCGKYGSVNESQRGTTNKLDRVLYRVFHGVVEGEMWGDRKKYDVCYITDPEQRAIVLYRLGRLLDKSLLANNKYKKINRKLKMVCPRCGLEGSINTQRGNKYFIRHRTGPKQICRMITPEDIEKVKQIISP